MAMSGLGIGRKAIETFAATYQTRLDPLPPANGVIGRDTYPSRVGDATAYPAFVVFFDHEIRTAGWRETVATYLPDLISGWVRDALHPAIRLAYGVEFEVETEVAAGLAYFASLGPDPALAATAAAAPPQTKAGPLLARTTIDAPIADGNFNQRYAQAVACDAFRHALTLPADASRSLPKEALGVFATTHDFFALHLVTGSHALRILAPFIQNSNALLAAGLFAAYLALDQPASESPIDDGKRLDALELSLASDEHDIKLAYSCLAQSRALNDNVFQSVAWGYLGSRIRS